MTAPAEAEVSIAVVVLTFNEADNLGAALDSVRGWAREVFVVDSYSTDRTVEVALSRRAEGIQVVQHAFEDFSRQWNWALTRLPISSRWILKLDADERVTPAFRSEVSRLITSASDDLEGVYFRRRIFFMNQPLRWGGTATNFDLRMWRAGKGRFDGREVNEHLVVSGRTARLESFVDHYDTKTLSEWVDKHNRYSSWEALSLIEMGSSGTVEARFWGRPDERRQWFRWIFFSNPFRFACAGLMFLYHYLLRLGCLDGVRGFQFAILRAFYFYLIDLKVLEYRRTGKAPTVVSPPRGTPHPELARLPLQQQVDRGPRDG